MLAKLKHIIQRIMVWLTVAKVGILLLAIAMLSGVFGYLNQHPGEFNPRDLIADFYANISAELASIAITVLIIDSLYRHREREREKEHLIRQLRSADVGIAREALEGLRMQGWLKDGTLRGSFLRGANLPEADLEEAILEEADLQETNLMGSNLQRTRLRAASLQNSNLWGSNLQGACLDGVRLEGANLGYVNLKEVVELNDTQLIHAESLIDATMPDGSRYDGRFNLKADLDQALSDGYNTGDATAMARFYEVSLKEYQDGQEWLHRYLSEFQKNSNSGKEQLC